MSQNLTILVGFLIFLGACKSGDPVQQQNQVLLQKINTHIKFIDSDPRVKVIEDDWKEGDTIYKTRAYFTDEELVKLIAVVRAANFERDDFFYFQYHFPIFTGHMYNEKKEHLASEYKFYYHNGDIISAMYWEDHYVPGKRFPTEKFMEYKPNLDSLENVEANRIKKYLSKIEEEGFILRLLNENLDANFIIK